MNKTTLCLALAAILLLNTVHARKTRNKRPKPEDDSTPQPNVVTYSNFGFNDVGNYDGFVPSSPDYSSFVGSRTRDSGTRLYAPAFPTAMDTIGFNNYGATSQDGQYEAAEDNTPQASMLQYPQSTMNFYSGSGMEASETQSRNVASEEIYRQNAEDVNSPIYGTKLGSKSRRPEYNGTDVNVYGGGANTMEVKYSTYHEVPSTHETKPTSFGEPNNSFQNSFQYNYQPTYPSNTESYMKSVTTTANPLKFPKVIDFTKYKSYYPSELESKFTSTSTKSPISYSAPDNSNDNNYNNFETQNSNNKYTHHTSLFNDEFVNKEDDVVEITEKPATKPSTYTHTDFSQNYLGHANKNTLKDSKYLEYKDKFKYNTQPTSNFSNDYKNWKSPFKGYQYSSDYSNTTFEFDFSGVKKPSSNVQSNNEDYVPASSSNVIDLTRPRHPQPETDYSSFKKFPGLKGAYSQNYDSFVKSFQTPEYDPEDYVRNIYSTMPTTTTHWGNVYKTSEFSSYKNHPKKPTSSHYGESLEGYNDEVIHIPKRPYGNNKLKYNTDSKLSDWSSLSNYRPYKSKKNKETTRFKSEEDLLGLRNHDTSHPSYLPTYRPNNDLLGEDFDYKKFVDKWRQSYMKAKYKDSMFNDFDAYQSESMSKQQIQHVPIPKPYPIEVPHPVIVPVLQPYPVQVPVPKPVAVPVVRELKVPIEKPVPYPVIKKVPYPVDKYVPVKVEKEVAVPVVKPYPVAIPHIRPVFHHSRPRDEDDSGYEEEEYLPRPESTKRVPYVKKIKSIRTRVRPSRPSRTFIHERNRRRWPAKRPYSDRPRKAHSIEFKSPAFRHHDFEEDDDREYIAYCKRTGNC